MIDRQGNKILFECDTCDDVFEGDEHEEFSDAWGRARRDGWRCRKVRDEWIHACPRHEV